MKREEFLLGVSIYTLIILAGFFRQTLQKLENNPLGKPFYSLAQYHFRPSVHLSNQKDKKPLLDSNFRQIFSSDSAVSISAKTQDSIRHNLEENWKRMASHPAGLGQETESKVDITPLLGRKPDPKGMPVVGGKASNGEEPTKG